MVITLLLGLSAQPFALTLQLVDLFKMPLGILLHLALKVRNLSLFLLDLLFVLVLLPS